jgi:hypothetical protein
MKFKLPKPTIALLLFTAFISMVSAQTRVIRGKVTSSDGEPVSGATLKLSGENKLTTSQDDGSYALAVNSMSGEITCQASGFRNAKATVSGEEIIFRLMKICWVLMLLQLQRWELKRKSKVWVMQPLK